MSKKLNEAVEIKKNSWTETKDTRDKLRILITRLNKITGKKFNSSKLNSINECCEYIYELFVEATRYSNNSRIIRELEILDLKRNILAFNKINDKILIGTGILFVVAVVEAIVIFNVM